MYEKYIYKIIFLTNYLCILYVKDSENYEFDPILLGSPFRVPPVVLRIHRQLLC